MGLVDFGFNFSKNHTSNHLNREDTAWLYGQQSDQWRANTEWFNDNGYSMLRKGLEKAGYNPLMALGAQPVSGATVSGSAMEERSNASSLGMSGLPLTSQAYKAQLRNVNADSLLKSAQTDETISRGNLENTLETIKSKEVPYAARKAEAEVLKLESEQKLVDEQINLVKEQTKTEISRQQLNQQEIKYKQSLVGLTNTEIQHYQKIIEQIDAGLELTAGDRAFLSKHPKQAEWISGVKQYAGAIGAIIAPVVSGAGAYVGAKAGRARNAEDVIKPVSDSVIISPTKIPF